MKEAELSKWEGGDIQNSRSLRQTVRQSFELPTGRLELYRTASLLPPPDGGLTAWLQVLSGFIVYFNTWGIINTFGVYQTYYEEHTLSDQSNSAISWIGSLQGAILLCLCLITGPAHDRGYCKPMMITGSFLMVFGMMMTSICKKYWQFMLAQGICVGVGNGILFIAGVAIIPTYFAKRRGLAAGIAASGSSVGGVLYPVIFQQLQPRIGFAWATRIIAFIMLATISVAIACTRLRQLPMKPRRFIDLDAFKYRMYCFFTASQFFVFAGVFIPFFYIQQYCKEKTNTSAELSYYSLATMSAGSLFGRVLPGLLADHIGTMNTLMICGPATLILVFAWVVIHNTAGILVFSVLYGFSSGGFVSLQSPTVAHMCPEIDHVGTWLGMVAFVSGLGILIGNPVAGAILTHGSWVGIQCLSGAFTLVGAILLVGARCAKSGTKIMVKS